MWDSDASLEAQGILTAVRLPHRVYVMWDSDASLEAQGIITVVMKLNDIFEWIAWGYGVFEWIASGYGYEV